MTTKTLLRFLTSVTPLFLLSNSTKDFCMSHFTPKERKPMKRFLKTAKPFLMVLSVLSSPLWAADAETQTDTDKKPASLTISTEFDDDHSSSPSSSDSEEAKDDGQTEASDTGSGALSTDKTTEKKIKLMSFPRACFRGAATGGALGGAWALGFQARCGETAWEEAQAKFQTIGIATFGGAVLGTCYYGFQYVLKRFGYEVQLPDLRSLITRSHKKCNHGKDD